MFDENFTFGHPASPTLTSTTDSSTRDSSRSVSPCSPTSAFPPPRFSVSDLSAQFADSRIQNNSRIFQDSCASYANVDDDADWSIPPLDSQPEYNPLSRSRTFPTRPHSPSRRTQRQVNSRLLCTSSSHRQELAQLVTRMIDSKDQCSISAQDNEDEGYDSAGDAPKSRRSSVAGARLGRPDMGYRRNSDMRTSGACVSKEARFRRGSERKQHQRVRSSEKS